MGSIPMFDRSDYQRIEKPTADTKLYYGTTQWKKRARQSKRRDRICQDCRRQGKPLVSHHLDRSHTGFEEPSDLTTLCRDCHARREGLVL
jgi:5-methylcytosine-specific restriction endonuclease McrA